MTNAAEDEDCLEKAANIIFTLPYGTQVIRRIIGSSSF
jgi:hypothetical protein